MRLLVVEDEPKLGALVVRALRAEGHAVDLCETGEDALWRAGSVAYDAIVLDVGLPGMDGFETCRRLRADEVWSPVLMLTARDAIGDRVEGLDVGADDYLVKPFAFGELLARLRALIRRGASDRPAVLEYLARHPGEAVSRTRLIEHVWDANFEGSMNIVDVYVGYLRRKLEQPFGRPLIRTLRGVGFTLRP